MNPYKTDKKDIEIFLNEMKNILETSTFDLERNLIIGKGAKEKINKNAQTMADLDFDKQDVKNELLKLQISDYYHTLPDSQRDNVPDFHVFFVIIQGREVYIKVRIQKINTIFCISFHFAEHSPGRFPYK
jgi:hypothetical protein